MDHGFPWQDPSDFGSGLGRNKENMPSQGSACSMRIHSERLEGLADKPKTAGRSDGNTRKEYD